MSFGVWLNIILINKDMLDKAVLHSKNVSQRYLHESENWCTTEHALWQILNFVVRKISIKR